MFNQEKGLQLPCSLPYRGQGTHSLGQRGAGGLESQHQRGTEEPRTLARCLPAQPSQGQGCGIQKDAYQLETAVICVFFSRMGSGDACLPLSLFLSLLPYSLSQAHIWVSDPANPIQAELFRLASGRAVWVWVCARELCSHLRLQTVSAAASSATKQRQSLC